MKASIPLGSGMFPEGLVIAGFFLKFNLLMKGIFLLYLLT